MNKKWIGLSAATLFLLTQQVHAEEEETHSFSLITSADLHGYIMPYDYRTNEYTEHGIATLHTLVKQLQETREQTLFVDNGDFIQGSDLAEYEAVTNPIEPGQKPAVVRAMEVLGVDVSVVGNHEFNFGLDFLANTIEVAEFPILAANVYDEATDERAYTPYELFSYDIGAEEELTVGVMGLTPPGSMQFDGFYLDGVQYITDMVEEAELLIPEMKEAGADIIVANAHTGIDAEFTTGGDNAAYVLAQVEGIDALVLGHQHADFPGGSRFDNTEGIDNESGHIFGVPAVMPNRYGTKAGTIDFDLTFENGEWGVANSDVAIHSTQGLEPSQEVIEVAQETHEEVISFYQEEVGQFETPITGFFARVTDSPLTQIINDAQTWYAKRELEGTEYENLPVLSAAAPFSTSVNIAANETLTRADMSAVYRFPNTIQVAKINGDQLKNWLEVSARNFNQIEPNGVAQPLVSSNFPGFDFDVIDGVTYEINLTKPEGERIENLRYAGEAVASDQDFAIALNNYRAGGSGGHVELDLNDDIIVRTNVLNRDAIMAYLDEFGQVAAEPTNNWTLTGVEGTPLTFSTEAAGASFVDLFPGITHQGEREFTFMTSDASEPGVPSPTFSDLTSESFAYHAITTLADQGVINGYPDGTFRPEASISRAEVAILLSNYLDLPEGEHGFTDVDTYHQHLPAISATYSAGIFLGDDRGRFHPEQAITRGETAAVLARAFALQSDGESGFNDGGQFEEEIAALSQAGITNGISATEFGTDLSVSRAQFAAFLYVLSQNS
ncbi:S-layer homology domain-containing protein [Paenalkalicoccus suaedae]|uniref:S-layer homology domain-containing protein n=1 Tax=Paenalkalicoccus suaedae TaxID=2592382 RepID=A0A859FAM7_9BACI|nr:S-layer homology domain-containing protein [Paenalkalicoccus suaedae]QKS70383.1 S-layer homology domain-containing protein [Paenalkalicoccus suaedae]